MQWKLVRCECGRAFGIRGGHRSSCTRCGSSSHVFVSEFADSKDLAIAVSNANMPKELAEEIASKSLKSPLPRMPEEVTPSSLIKIMKEATDDEGFLSIESLQSSLHNSDIYSPTSEYLIGQAESEGVIIRTKMGTWEWV